MPRLIGRRVTRSSLIAAAVTVATALAMSVTAAVSAHAATADRYHVELTAWIPHATVQGPIPAGRCPWALGQGTATYNGNNHVGYDGGYKARVSYDFTYDGSQ